jgi:hypothetical protein
MVLYFRLRSQPNERSEGEGGTPRLWRAGRLSPAAPHHGCSSMAGRSSGFTNPEGWQAVAGGRNAVETPGSGWIGSCILEGCQSAATPPGSMGDLGRRSGGVAPAFAPLRRGKSLDPRLPSGKPPACFPADPKTNERPPADAGTGVCLHIERYRPGAADAGCWPIARMIQQPPESSREEAQKAQKGRAPVLRFLRLLAASSFRPSCGRPANQAATLDGGRPIWVCIFSPSARRL